MGKSHTERFTVGAFAHDDNAIIFMVEDMEKKVEYFGTFDKHLIEHYRAQLTDNPIDMFNSAIAKHAYEVEIILNGNKVVIDFNRDDETITIICARSQMDKMTSLCLNAMKHHYGKLKTQCDELNTQTQKQHEEIALLRDEIESVKKSVTLVAVSSDDCVQNVFMAELHGRDV